MELARQNIEQHWQAWVEVVERERSNLEQILNSPASEQELSAAEAALGVALSAEFHDLYRLHNGGSTSNDLFCGLSFMSLETVIAQWQSTGRGLEDLDEDDLRSIEEELSVEPLGAIKQQYFNRAWIPFATDGSGNFVGVDLDPGENGSRGQVINFGRDDLEMFVIAPDIAGFLATLRHLTEEGPYQRPHLLHDLWTYLYG